MKILSLLSLTLMIVTPLHASAMGQMADTQCSPAVVELSKCFKIELPEGTDFDAPSLWKARPILFAKNDCDYVIILHPGSESDGCVIRPETNAAIPIDYGQQWKFISFPPGGGGNLSGIITEYSQATDVGVSKMSDKGFSLYRAGWEAHFDKSGRCTAISELSNSEYESIDNSSEIPCSIDRVFPDEITFFYSSENVYTHHEGLPDGLLEELQTIDSYSSKDQMRHASPKMESDKIGWCDLHTLYDFRLENTYIAATNAELKLISQDGVVNSRKFPLAAFNNVFATRDFSNGNAFLCWLSLELEAGGKVLGTWQYIFLDKNGKVLCQGELPASWNVNIGGSPGHCDIATPQLIGCESVMLLVNCTEGECAYAIVTPKQSVQHVVHSPAPIYIRRKPYRDAILTVTVLSPRPGGRMYLFFMPYAGW